MRVQVPFKLEQAQAIVKQLRDGKINHIGLTPNRTVDGRQYTTLARLLDMSQKLKFTIIVKLTTEAIQKYLNHQCTNSFCSTFQSRLDDI
jgi:hypothetical protein